MNTERKILLGTAEIQVEDEALGTRISTCDCCGEIITDEAEHFIFRAPSRVNGVHMHRKCMMNHKGADVVGSDSKNADFKITYTIASDDEEAVGYAVFACDHTTKKSGFMVKVESPTYTSSNAFTKHFNGLKAYDVNRKCTVYCEGRKYDTRIADVVEVVKVAQKIADLESRKPNGYMVKVNKALQMM